jgi:hypothetical protein
MSFAQPSKQWQRCHFMRLQVCLLLAAAPSFAAITVSNITDKAIVDAPRSFTVTADPAAATTTATLNGVPVPVGSAVNVTAIGFQELRAESRDAGGAIVDTEYIRFVTADPTREGSEYGIPPHTPYNSVNDAPSAFAGLTLKVIAPAAWPTGFPLPMAAKLVNGANESVRLNGLVAFGGFPGTTLKMRRGWGSVNVPAQTTPGLVDVNAVLNGLAHNPQVDVQAMTFTDVSGTIAANTTWPANSRMRITNTLTISAGATLTIGQGTIVLLSTGTATNGSAAEISVSGTLQINGAEANPVVFAPATPGLYWGGIELPVATSTVNASWAIFTGSGEDENWTANSSIDGPSHQSEQPVFAVGGSGSGTSIGAQLHLSDCFSFEHAGQQMNSRTNVWVDLQRTLFQKCITSGELSGARVTIDRSALIEFPNETGNFVNDDNDALYMTNGDLSITNTVIGFTKDDGVDTGGDGGNSPFGTVNPLTGDTVTRYDSTNNWYEGTTHEGNSLSGTRHVYFTNCVFLNCGQGVESGYSAGSGNGPNATIDGCLFVNNMVGVRWGDNYEGMSSYNGSVELLNSIIINSTYRDLFSYNWRDNLTTSWIYQTTNTNSFGRPIFNAHDSLVSMLDTVNHPATTQWNPNNPAHAIDLAPYMPVPGSNVGVAISTYAAQQQPTTAYAGTFTVRLSTFSSNTVSVDWAVVGKADPFADSGATLASGTLTFPPGETLRTITAPVAAPGNFGLIHVALRNPVNAEVTGEKVYVQFPGALPTLTFFTYGSGGTGTAGSGTPGSVWRYKTDFTSATIGAIPATWKNPGFDDSSWASGPSHIGFGDNDENTPVARTDYDAGTTGTQSGPSYLFRATFTIPNLLQLASVTGDVKSDDGAVVYVNGNEVLRSTNIAPGAALTDYAIFNNAAARENGTEPLTVPLGLLNNGVNTIAVEIHNRDIGSSDMSFDLRLTGNPVNNAPLTLNVAPTRGTPVMWWFGGGDILERSTNLLNWLPYPVTGSPVTIVPDEPREFFRLRRPQ